MIKSFALHVYQHRPAATEPRRRTLSARNPPTNDLLTLPSPQTQRHKKKHKKNQHESAMQIWDITSLHVPQQLNRYAPACVCVCVCGGGPFGRDGHHRLGFVLRSENLGGWLNWWKMCTQVVMRFFLSSMILLGANKVDCDFSQLFSIYNPIM